MDQQEIINKIELEALLNEQANQDEAESGSKPDPNRKPDFDSREKPKRAEDPSIECRRGMETYIQKQLKKGPCGNQKNYVNWQPGASPFAAVKIPDIQTNLNHAALPSYGEPGGQGNKVNPAKAQIAGEIQDLGCKDKKKEGLKFKQKTQGQGVLDSQ
jgi:hypothetical protein